MTGGSQLGTDLVGAAGDQVAFQQGQTPSAGQRPIFGHRRSGAGHGTGLDKDLLLGLVLPQIPLQRAIRRLDLLRGERGTVPEPEPTIRQALAFLARQAKERTRRKWSQVLGGTCALLMAGFVLFAILDRAGVFLQEISLEVPATVYSAEGVSAGETTVAIDGSVKILGDRSFEGQFAIHEVETTYREGVHANIRWDAMWTGAQDILFYRAGEFCTLGVERMLYITENMQSFGLRLEDGTIITTDEAYVPLLMSGYYYSIRPIFSNQF